MFQAQTEEHAVFKKCNTVVIYKSSALLTINKLRKESLGKFARPMIAILSMEIFELIIVLLIF